MIQLLNEHPGCALIALGFVLMFLSSVVESVCYAIVRRHK